MSADSSNPPRASAPPFADLAAEARVDFDILLGVCAQLSEVKPVEEVLGELLLQARRLTRAEAGTVLIATGERLRFVCTQNDARPDLEQTARLNERRSAPNRVAPTLPIDDGSLAGYAAHHRQPLRIDDVYALPAGSPLRFDATVDARTGYRSGSMLVTPLVDRTGYLAGVLQLINRRGGGGVEPFTEKDLQISAGLGSLAAVTVRNAQMREELARSHLDTILRLATAAEFRDGETSEHIRRVSLYCETIARTMGMPVEWSQLMLFASPMHDIGKLGVPDAVLQKPGPLNPAERVLMEAHTTIGGRILNGSNNELIQVAEKIAVSHHEKWDGSGYPLRLSGTNIPLEGRMTAVADVFDALSSHRVYKEAYTLDRSFQEIGAKAGTHFDPDVAAAFLQARPDIEAVYEAYAPVSHAGASAANG